MIQLPYFKQDTTYSCGPVVMEMVFRYYGKVFSEKKLVEMLETRSDIGTRHSAMIEVARQEGFYVYVNNDSSLEEVSFLIDKKTPVIVHYIEPDTDDGHYAVIVSVGEKTIVLDDPWNGEKFHMPLRDFEARWHSERGNHKRWIMVISDEDVHIGKQYRPKEGIL